MDDENVPAAIDADSGVRHERRRLTAPPDPTRIAR